MGFTADLGEEGIHVEGIPEGSVGAKQGEKGASIGQPGKRFQSLNRTKRALGREDVAMLMGDGLQTGGLIKKVKISRKNRSQDFHCLMEREKTRMNTVVVYVWTHGFQYI